MRTMVLALLVLLAVTVPAYAAGSFCTDQARSIVVLIDKTSPFGQEEQSVLTSALGQIINHEARPFNLQLIELTDTVRAARRSPLLCVPGCGRSNASCQTPTDRQMAEFNSTLPSMVRTFATTSEVDREQAEVLELIEELAPGHQDATRIDLVLITDLLQNSVNSRGFLLKHRKALQQALVGAAGRMGSILKGGSVVVLGYGYDHGEIKQRLSTQLDGMLRELWSAFFVSIGAGDVELGYSYEFALH